MSAYAQTSDDPSVVSVSSENSVTTLAAKEVVETWEIGSPNASDVIATLYSDGSFVVSGEGDTETYSGFAPWYSYRTQITSVTFEVGVTPTSLAYWFYYCTNLTEVSALPDSVTSLYYTFAWCTSLVEAPEIPEGVMDMRYTFMDCFSLEKAPKIPEGVTDLTYTFAYCFSLVEAPEIPEGVMDMSYTFEGCTSLEKAPDIPGSVTDMSYTFEACTSLVEAPEIPDSVTNMRGTFYYCPLLVEAPEIPDSVTDMRGTFGYCTSLVEAPAIPDGVTNLSDTFYCCTSLVEAPVIPDGVTNMYFTFAACSSLEVAPEIPNSVTNMSYTFYGCTSLVEAPLIPSTVTDMSYAFYSCTSLTSLPDGFSIPEGADTTEAFGFSSYYIPDENVVTYCSADDYEALAAAYDWENSYRTLTVRGASQNPGADDSESPILTYSGSTRYETASWIVSQEILIAQSLGITFEGIIVANGDDEHFADALAASGLSGLLNYPIVLTSDSSLSSYAESVISQIAAAANNNLDIIVLGDDNSISQTARTQLDTYGDLVELQGADRYATAQEIYDYGAEAANWNTEYTIITTGEKFPDALSIASYAAYANARVVLVNGTLGSLPASTAAEIAGSENIIILGDANAVSEGIENELKGIVGEDKVTRLQGENRYETSAAVAAWALGQGMTLEGAGFATGEKPADALASSTLLGMTGSVLLLVSPTSSNNTAALELVAAYAEGVSSINIFGDTNSVSTATISSITSALGW